jgi:hypothetical protein
MMCKYCAFQAYSLTILSMRKSTLTKIAYHAEFTVHDVGWTNVDEISDRLSGESLFTQLHDVRVMRIDTGRSTKPTR